MRQWAGGALPEPNEVDESFKSGANNLGVDWRRLQPPANAAQTRAPQELELWAEHHFTWEVFVHCETSWSWVAPAMARPFRVGIPRRDVAAVAQMMGMQGEHGEQRAQAMRLLLDGIRIAEDEALTVWSQRSQ